MGVELDQPIYAFDSTTIDLCLPLFPWARFRRRNAAVKLPTLRDIRGNIPCFIHMTEGRTADVQVLDELVPEPGAFSLMDRGDIDFQRRYGIPQDLAFFVTRSQDNLDYRRCDGRPVDQAAGLRCDQTILLRGRKSARASPAPLRRIRYYDVETDRPLVFLTKRLTLPPLVIAQLYKRRWRVE